MVDWPMTVTTGARGSTSTGVRGVVFLDQVRVRIAASPSPLLPISSTTIMRLPVITW